MSDIDDAKKWVEASDNYKKSDPSQRGQVAPPSQVFDDKEENKHAEPWRNTQYAIYGKGYVPTTRTIKSLPAGCYDLDLDNKCVFATPMPKPGGLLLELPEMRSEEVIKVIENFWNSEADYKIGNEFVTGGASYKAGVMVYGPPGTGKSCTLKIVANKMIERGGIVFYASIVPSLVMKFLIDFAKIEKNRKCIVILEDLDSLIETFRESGYLDMLDSAHTIDNVLFIATTNYPERLDPRIYNRPGRFSHVIEIGYPKAAARTAYLKAILKNYRDLDVIVDQTAGFSIDHLSALVNAVYREKKDLAKEIERLRILFKVPPTTETKSLGIGATFETDDD